MCPYAWSSCPFIPVVLQIFARREHTLGDEVSEIQPEEFHKASEGDRPALERVEAWCLEYARDFGGAKLHPECQRDIAYAGRDYVIAVLLDPKSTAQTVIDRERKRAQRERDGTEHDDPNASRDQSVVDKSVDTRSDAIVLEEETPFSNPILQGPIRSALMSIKSDARHDLLVLRCGLSGYKLRQPVTEFPDFKLEATRKKFDRAQEDFMVAFDIELAKSIRAAKKASLAAADLGVLQATRRRVQAAIARDLAKAKRAAARIEERSTGIHFPTISDQPTP